MLNSVYGFLRMEARTNVQSMLGKKIQAILVQLNIDFACFFHEPNFNSKK